MRTIATVNLGYQPSLTLEKVQEIIQKHLGYTPGTKQGDRFHTIVKSPSVAAIIKLKQYDDSTGIQIGGTFPEFWKDTLLMLACLFTGVGFFAWIVYSIIHLN